MKYVCHSSFFLIKVPRANFDKELINLLFKQWEYIPNVDLHLFEITPNPSYCHSAKLFRPKHGFHFHKSKNEISSARLCFDLYIEFMRWKPR